MDIISEAALAPNAPPLVLAIRELLGEAGLSMAEIVLIDDPLSWYVRESYLAAVRGGESGSAAARRDGMRLSFRPQLDGAPLDLDTAIACEEFANRTAYAAALEGRRVAASRRDGLLSEPAAPSPVQ